MDNSLSSVGQNGAALWASAQSAGRESGRGVQARPPASSTWRFINQHSHDPRTHPIVAPSFYHLLTHPKHVAGTPTPTLLSPGADAGSRTLPMALPGYCCLCLVISPSSLSFISPSPVSRHLAISPFLLSLPGGRSGWPSPPSLVLLEVAAC